MGYEFVKVEKKDHITIVTLNRPEVMNALHPPAHVELGQVFDEFDADESAWVAIVTGAGEKAFSAGNDLKVTASGQTFPGLKWKGGFAGLAERYDLSKPIIAAVQGYCIGGSNHLAYCCDFTIAADNAIFAQAGPKVSSPADGYFVPYLVSVVGAKKAREMWMLCRRYPAKEAEAMGLVNTVVPLDRLEAEVERWCEEMLALSPGCLEILKATFDQGMDGFAEMGEISSSMYPDWFDSPEGKEGGAAFAEKRPPRFWDIRAKEAEARLERLAEDEGGAP